MKRIIFTGKGGVGKTTILSNLVRLLVMDGQKVLAIDCDPSMNLAMSLGIALDDVVSLAEDKAKVQRQLEAELRLQEHEDDDDEEHEHKPLPPGKLSEYIITTKDGISLIVMGTIPYGGAGCLCAPIALVKMLVTFLSNGSEDYDYIIIDSQAGVEIFGRGLATEFDMALVITEPTPKSLEVAKHGSRLARDLGVKKQVAVINKVEDENDVAFAKSQISDSVDLILTMGYDVSVREADKKGMILLDLNPHAAALADIKRIKDCITGEI